ncbi:MAG: hypothetical protein ACRC57_12750 [Sarcina sp.]
MPIPIILGVGAAIAGAVGVGSGVHGASKMKKANDTMKSADVRHKENIAKVEKKSNKTIKSMDELGKKELEILKSFDNFTVVFEKIKGRPQFKTYDKNGVNIPEYDAEELKNVSIGAGVLLGGISGAAAGTVGGFAAAGATTSAVMALGTASTGTAIASLSGAAATNATLAAIGGGAIAAGGGGIALGTTILGAATLGVGLLVGGVIFNVTGSSLSSKADEAWNQMLKAETEMSKIGIYLRQLDETAIRYNKSISRVDAIYKHHLSMLTFIVEENKKKNWNELTQVEKTVAENTALLVKLLFDMGKVNLVLTAENKNEQNKVNFMGVNKAIKNAETFIKEKELVQG